MQKKYKHIRGSKTYNHGEVRERIRTAIWGESEIYESTHLEIGKAPRKETTVRG